jgi:hypothetical protein
MADRVDRSLASAEAQLDRIDDGVSDDDGPSGNGSLDGAGTLDTAEFADGMHIEADDSLDDDAALGLTTEEIMIELGGGLDGELADCVDAFNEAFNARDLDSLLELVTDDCETPGLGNDLDNLPASIEDLWQRRPTCLLTRGELDHRCVGVMWEVGDGGSWWRVATLHYDDCSDGQMGVLEFSDDPSILPEVETGAPDADLDEGTRWEEWTDGAITES